MTQETDPKKVMFPQMAADADKTKKGGPPRFPRRSRRRYVKTKAMDICAKYGQPGHICD